MFATRLTSGFVAFALLSPTALIAQPDSQPYVSPEEFYKPVPPLNPDLHFTYDHASTAAEGWLRGQAALTHATGSYWLSLSQALICREQARWLALDNQRRWIEYRRGLRAWREEDLTRSKEAKRVKHQASRRSKYAVYLLSADELDRATGRIVWPEMLQGREYTGLRERLDALFQARVGCQAAQCTEMEIDRCVERLIRELRRHVGETDRNEYLTAQAFLRGLKYESKVRPQIKLM
jgi:hypothetical protein